eukprot:COSAG06_NODE_54702_length_293_cov_0.798969_1_plen_37_part_01
MTLLMTQYTLTYRRIMMGATGSTLVRCVVRLWLDNGW